MVAQQAYQSYYRRRGFGRSDQHAKVKRKRNWMRKDGFDC